MRTFARLRSLIRLRRAQPNPSRQSRRQVSRAAVWSGLIAFTLATVGLSATVEVARPEWRDPEFGYRLVRLRKLKAEAPDRPIILFVGSSRIQLGISPTEMGFPDVPGSPLAFNGGYPGGMPVLACLQAHRFLDADVQPRAILFSFAYVELQVHVESDLRDRNRGAQLSFRELQQLRPYCGTVSFLSSQWAAARLQPWFHQREFLYVEYPEWYPGDPRILRRRTHTWRTMDSRGLFRWPAEVTAQERARVLAAGEPAFRPGLSGRAEILPENDRAIRDLVRRCQREGVAFAGLCPPESPIFRSWYTPDARAAYERYTRTFSAEMGIPIFPAPDHLTEEDFLDGYHLVGSGPAKYSRWLADTHLKPWLASSNLAKNSH